MRVFITREKDDSKLHYVKLCMKFRETRFTTQQETVLTVFLSQFSL